MIIVQHTILTSKLNSRWRACQVSETVWCGLGQAASVNMTLISHRTLVYFFTTVLLGDVSHFQTSGTFTKKPYKKGSHRFSSWFSCTFCPDFVDLYTSQWLKRSTDHDWGCKTSSYQMKAACECSAFWSRTLPPIPDPPPLPISAI